MLKAFKCNVSFCTCIICVSRYDAEDVYEYVWHGDCRWRSFPQMEGRGQWWVPWQRESTLPGKVVALFTHYNFQPFMMCHFMYIFCID